MLVAETNAPPRSEQGKGIKGWVKKIVTKNVGDGDAHGRPVGVAIDQRGALLVADDVGNIIWRLTDSTGTARVGSR